MGAVDEEQKVFFWTYKVALEKLSKRIRQLHISFCPWLSLNLFKLNFMGTLMLMCPINVMRLVTGYLKMTKNSSGSITCVEHKSYSASSQQQ